MQTSFLASAGQCTQDGHRPNPPRRCRTSNSTSTSFSKTEYVNPISNASARIKHKLDFLAALISPSCLPALCLSGPNPQGQPRTAGQTLSQTQQPRPKVKRTLAILPAPRHTFYVLLLIICEIIFRKKKQKNSISKSPFGTEYKP